MALTSVGLMAQSATYTGSEKVVVGGTYTYSCDDAKYQLTFVDETLNVTLDRADFWHNIHMPCYLRPEFSWATLVDVVRRKDGARRSAVFGDYPSTTFGDLAANTFNELRRIVV